MFAPRPIPWSPKCCCRSSPRSSAGSTSAGNCPALADCDGDRVEAEIITGKLNLFMQLVNRDDKNMDYQISSHPLIDQLVKSSYFR